MKYRDTVALIILITVFCCDDRVPLSDRYLVEEIFNSVELDSLTKRVRELSGEVPVWIAGEQDTIFSRHKDYPGNELAADYTVIYALWDEKEQGLHGSGFYAANARGTNQGIAGVINIDMIGWDSNNDGRFYVNVKDTSSSRYLSERLLEVHDIFEFDLEPVLLNPGSGSDNLVFWYYGFGAIGVEEMYGEDWNEYYHTTGDRLEQFNLAYFEDCSRLLTGTLAALVFDADLE